MSEPTNSDLAVQIAELRGEVRGMSLAHTTQIDGLRAQLDASLRDREGIHAEIERRVETGQQERERMWGAVRSLQDSRNRVVGAMWVVGGLLTISNVGIALYATLHH